MRLGIFGGTFNPVHYGHLINAEIIRERFSLEKILFIPSKHPVHKEIEGSISAGDRVKMLELALEGSRNMEVSSIEIEKESPSFTIYTVNELRVRYPEASLFMIIGEDSYYEIQTWKDYRELISRVSVIVMRRQGCGGNENPAVPEGSSIYFAENPFIELSSTMIRKRVGENLSVRYMMPEKVRQYILKTGLYGR